VPVIFPQFSDRGPLQRHGFARMLPWQVLRQDCGADSASAVLRLTDTSHTRALWPHGFALELTLQVGSDALSLQLACRNTGADSFRFQAALHSYFRVGDLSRCILTGLEGRRYWDALDRAERQQTGPVALADGDLDRVYSRVAEPLRLQEAAGHGQARCAQIGQQGFEDVVVWNPGAAKCAALADMPAQGWRHMVCVEAARIHAPITLAPGESWHGTQTVRCQAPVP